MLPESSEVTFSAAGCRYHKRSEVQGQWMEKEFRFTVSEEELRGLYLTLVDAPFDRITTHHEEIYDRGGYQVTVRADGKTFTVVDGGQSVVDAFWQPAWKTIYDRILRLEEAAIEQAGS